jgi:hypothetical protein
MLRLRVSVGWFAVTAPLNTAISVVVSFTGAEGGRTKFQFAASSKSVFTVPLQTLDAPDTLDPLSAHIARRKKTAKQMRRCDNAVLNQKIRLEFTRSFLLANSFLLTRLIGAVPVQELVPENTYFHLWKVRS